jgi:hypothetical protein
MRTEADRAIWDRPARAGRLGPSVDAQPPDTPPPPATEVRYLTPDMCDIHLGDHGTLHVAVEKERTYGGVYAAYAFPVAHSDKYISLMHTGGDSDEMEIGIIRNLGEFPGEQAALVREALERRYFVHTILRIHKVGWQYGLVRLDVDTDKGRIEVLMRWKHNCAVDYGQRGKVLIDVYRNRYLIPDMAALSPKERNDFKRIIYW